MDIPEWEAHDDTTAEIRISESSEEICIHRSEFLAFCLYFLESDIARGHDLSEESFAHNSEIESVEIDGSEFFWSILHFPRIELDNGTLEIRKILIRRSSYGTDALLPHFLRLDELIETISSCTNHVRRDITSIDFRDSHIRSFDECRPESTEWIIDSRKFLTRFCRNRRSSEIDHHLDEFRRHHPDDHITRLSGITIRIGIDILTGNGHTELLSYGCLDEIVFCLRFSEFFSFENRTDDVPVLDIDETRRKTSFLKRFLDTKSDIRYREIDTIASESEREFSSLGFSL